MKRVTLSIIIVSYNTQKLTVACIKSIIKHKPAFPFEIIVIDNASTDNSVSEIKKLGIKNLLLLENENNEGFSKANNMGLELSYGEYALLLNSDTEIIDASLTQLVNFAKQTKDAGIVAPQLLNPDKTVQPSIYKLPTISRAIAQYIFKRKGILNKYSLEGAASFVVESVVGAAFLITPVARKRVGELDEKFFMYFEDLDYCRRVNSKGLKVYYLPDVHLIHVHGASGKGGVNTLLIESSKKYFGIVRYYLYTFVLWFGQKYGTN